MINGAESTPRPPETDSRAAGWAGSGNSQLRPRYWALELLMIFCGLKSVLNGSPFAEAQLAWSCVRGVAARAADFGFAAAPSTPGAPIDDTKKSNVTAIAEIEVLETFVMLTPFDS